MARAGRDCPRAARAPWGALQAAAPAGPFSEPAPAPAPAPDGGAGVPPAAGSPAADCRSLVLSADTRIRRIWLFRYGWGLSIAEIESRLELRAADAARAALELLQAVGSALERARVPRTPSMTQPSPPTAFESERSRNRPLPRADRELLELFDYLDGPLDGELRTLVRADRLLQGAPPALVSEVCALEVQVEAGREAARHPWPGLDVEGLVSEVVAQLVRRFETPSRRPRGSFAGYVRMTTRRRLRKQGQREARRRDALAAHRGELEEAQSQRTASPLPDERALARLPGALAGLRPEQRALYGRLFQERRSQREVARLLGVSEPTVARRKLVLMRELTRLLGEE